MWNAYEEYKKYEVAAENIEDFLKRYTKPSRLERREPDYMQARIKSHTDDLNKYGFTFMTKHESITGETISYYGKNSL